MYEPEFEYRNVVVFSCGINDMSCYGLREHILADIIWPKIAETAKSTETNTTFVFNSILYTRHPWFNSEMDVLNRTMCELSLQTRILFLFFDSSAVISYHPISKRLHNVIEPKYPRKLHITDAACVIIADSLSKGLAILCRRAIIKLLPSGLRNWCWPLRRKYINAILFLQENLESRAVSQS